MMKNNELCRAFAKWQPNCVSTVEPEPVLTALAGPMAEVKDGGALDRRIAARRVFGQLAALAESLRGKRARSDENLWNDSIESRAPAG
jgi:hypothetical protein